MFKKTPLKVKIWFHEFFLHTFFFGKLPFQFEFIVWIFHWLLSNRLSPIQSKTVIILRFFGTRTWSWPIIFLFWLRSFTSGSKTPIGFVTLEETIIVLSYRRNTDLISREKKMLGGKHTWPKTPVCNLLWSSWASASRLSWKFDGKYTYICFHEKIYKLQFVIS